MALVAHSLGCLAVAWWAAQASPDSLSKIRGALLVAPPDVDHVQAHRLLRPFAPAPPSRLPFPSMLVASRTDPYAAFAGLAKIAGEWGAALVDAGDAGHINVESGVEDRPDGLVLLDRLRLGWPAGTIVPRTGRTSERNHHRGRSRRT